MRFNVILCFIHLYTPRHLSIPPQFQITRNYSTVNFTEQRTLVWSISGICRRLIQGQILKVRVNCISCIRWWMRNPVREQRVGSNVGMQPRTVGRQDETTLCIHWMQQWKNVQGSRRASCSNQCKWRQQSEQESCGRVQTRQVADLTAMEDTKVR